MRIGLQGLGGLPFVRVARPNPKPRAAPIAIPSAMLSIATPTATPMATPIARYLPTIPSPCFQLSLAGLQGAFAYRRQARARAVLRDVRERQSALPVVPTCPCHSMGSAGSKLAVRLPPGSIRLRLVGDARTMLWQRGGAMRLRMSPLVAVMLRSAAGA